MNRIPTKRRITWRAVLDAAFWVASAAAIFWMVYLSAR
jgi:hypothetical protein